MFISGNQGKSDSFVTDRITSLSDDGFERLKCSETVELKAQDCFKSSRKTDNKLDFLCCSANDLPNKNVKPTFFFGTRWQKTLSEVSPLPLSCLHMGFIIKQQGNLK